MVGTMTKPLTITAVACAAVLAVAARGEDDHPVDDVAQFRGVQRQGHEVDLGAHFDANLLSVVELVLGNNRAPSKEKGEGRLRAALEKRGDAWLARIDALCGLSAAQRSKLELAIAYDIRRLMEDLEPTLLKYRGVKTSVNDPKWVQCQEDMARCQQRIRGLLGSQSLFEKSLPTTLDAAQFGRLTADSEARRQYRWRGLVAVAMVGFDDMLGLDQQQCDALEALLVAKQPRMRDENVMGGNPTVAHAERMLVPMVLSGIDGQQLQAILNERQEKALMTVVGPTKFWRQHLEGQGVLEKEEK